MVNHQKGLVVVLIFYVVIAGVGIWASMKHKTGEERFKKVNEKKIHDFNEIDDSGILS